MDPNEALEGLRRYSAEVQALAVAMSDVAPNNCANCGRELPPGGGLSHMSESAQCSVCFRDRWPGVAQEKIAAAADAERLIDIAAKLTAAAVEQAEHVEALDEWLHKGGVLPSDWQRELTENTVATWCAAHGYTLTRATVHVVEGE